MTPTPASAAAIAHAAAQLRNGGLVAFPTETVYGLGADATDGVAVARIFETKGRPRFNPLIAHVANLAEARKIAVLGPLAARLGAAFWPGGLTLVLQATPDAGISDLVTAGLATIAVRVPSHPVAHDLIVAAGRPIAGPSANRSGRVSPTTAQHVADDLGDAVDIILDGGACRHGLESTIVDLSGDLPTLLRPGAVAAADIERELGQPLWRRHSGGAPARPRAPGQLESHYAPRARLRLNAHTVQRGEALLAFGDTVPAHTGPTINLSTGGNLRQAAAALFAALRQLDATGSATIAVMPIPDTGLGEAINDRLRRAAAPRPAV
jgi:L-threonylcarbamoyladenylate synthase